MELERELAKIAANRSLPLSIRQAAIAELRKLNTFCDAQGCNQPADNKYPATAFTAAVNFCDRHAREWIAESIAFGERNY